MAEAAGAVLHDQRHAVHVGEGAANQTHAAGYGSRGHVVDPEGAGGGIADQQPRRQHVAVSEQIDVDPAGVRQRHIGAGQGHCRAVVGHWNPDGRAWGHGDGEVVHGAAEAGRRQIGRSQAEYARA
ncbi:hypothetical protein D3C71_1335560 [compost metagenome]